MPSKAINVAIVNDYEIVVAGLTTMLARYRDRVKLTELGPGLVGAGDVDIILYDTFSRVAGKGVDVDDLVALRRGKLVLYSWSGVPAYLASDVRQRVSAHLSKALTARELVESLEAIHEGTPLTRTNGELGNAVGHGSWPGKDTGLNAREAEVLSLIARGLSNEQITRELFLGINTVKTYIRTAYRKLGVTTRTQAVLWALAHGFTN